MIIHQAMNTGGSYVYVNHIYRDRDFAPHFHSNYELVYIFCGQLEAIIDGRKIILNPGDFALCLSNEVHHYQSIGSTRYYVGVFSADFVPEFHKAVAGKTGRISRFRCEGSILSFLLEHILLGRARGTPPFHLLVAGLNIACGEYQKQTELIDRDNKEYALMNTIADYIGKHFRRKLTLKEVATVLGYDYYYFSRLFYQIFSMKFSDYLNACRFSAAVDALHTTDRSITDIALDSGFQSIRSFNDVFLRRTGMSPAQYRKQLQHNT